MSLTIITPEESQKAHARLADEIHAALTAIDPKSQYPKYHHLYNILRQVMELWKHTEAQNGLD